MLLLVDFFLNLLFSLLDEPFNQACVVLLGVDHVLLLSQKGFGSELLFLVVDHPVQLSVLGCVAGCWFLVERLLRRRKSAGEPPISIEFLACHELIEAKEEGLCSFWAKIDNRFVLLLGDFEFLLGED